MVGGKGLDEFRKEMIKDRRMKVVVHFPREREVFPTVVIKGGVNYFLWDNEHDGICEFKVGNSQTNRFLDEFDIVVQDNQAVSILNKIIKYKKRISEKCFGRKPFGLATNFENWIETGTICYSIRNKINYVASNAFTDKNKIIKKWKVATSKAGSPNVANGEIPVISNMFIIEPDAICTETYIIVNVFDTKKEAENFVSYMKTKFFRFMLGLRALTQDINKEKFKWVPDVEDYSDPWTDEELYKKFNLTRQEREYIESKIKELK